MKIFDLLEGAEKGGTTLGGFPVKVLHIQDSGQPEIDEEGVAEGQLDELSKDTIKSYVPKRIEKTRGLASTDYDKAHRIANKDIPRAIKKLKDPEYGKEGVAEGADDKFSVADKVEELVDQYRLYDKRGWSDLFTNLAGRKLEVAEIRREMEYASKFLQLLDSIRMRSDYRGKQNPKLDQELIDLSNQWLDLFNKATSEFKGMSGQGVMEGLEQLNRIRKLSGLDEALKLDAPQQAWSKQDMQDYATRIKTGTKTKQDRFKPIIHGSNIKAITKDDGGEEWDLDDLAKQITTRPRAILGTNAKMAKSKKEGAITYDLTLPALSGIVVDEDTGEFVEIITCPGAGECQNYCYARKGGYVMFPASSMSAAQALNFLVNHPTEYMKMFDGEVKKAKALADKNGIKLLVRIHDAGDFFSKEYYNLVMGVKADNPGVTFYFYTKMGDIASADQPDDVIGQFSPGAKSREVKAVQAARAAGKHVKDAVTLPKDMFRDLFVTDAKGKYVKDDQGRTQVKSSEAWSEFQRKLAAEYNIDPESIITYDQMNKIPEPEPTGTKDQLQKDGTIKQVPVYPPPKWNVVIFPAGHGDVGAARRDVSKQFLMFH